MSTCDACTRPCPDARICRSCVDELVTELRSLLDSSHFRLLPKTAREQHSRSAGCGLLTELETTLTRQARVGHRNGPRSAERPLDFHFGASVDLETLRDALAMWATVVAEQRGIQVDAARTAPDLARWLIRWAGEAAQHPDAAELHGDIIAMTKAAKRTIDLAPDLRYVGPCDGHQATYLPAAGTCGQDLYVGMRASEVICGTEDCAAVYPIEQRRAWLLEQAVDQLRTARQLAYELPWIAGVTINVKTIGMWSARGKLTKYLPHPQDERQAARFRVGEVIELGRKMAADAAARHVNGAA